MKVTIVKAKIQDAPKILEMQKTAFLPLLRKYKDHETNPANEDLKKIIQRFNQPDSDYYFIYLKENAVGAIRIVRQKEKYRISPIFVLPDYQGRGIAQKALLLAEKLYKRNTGWELSTILQEKGNCRLYEKMGYRPTGKTQTINDKLTLIFYTK